MVKQYQLCNPRPDHQVACKLKKFGCRSLAKIMRGTNIVQDIGKKVLASN